MSTHQTAPVFEMNSVRVVYGFRCAVDNLSLALEKGRSMGLLGLNGAGKTSTIGAILGMLRPRRGSVRLFGERPGSTKNFRRIGFAPEDGIPPEYLNAEEYLSFVGAYRIRDRAARTAEIKSLLDWFELLPKKRIRTYSKGMKRRLILAQAFLGNPEFLILDEPLNGLDPLIIIKLREKLVSYRNAGGTILYSSHILNEVEKSCSDIAILNEGKLVSISTVDAVKSEFGSVEAAFAAKIKSPESRTVSEEKCGP